MGKKRKPECKPLELWLVTFSDLTTLLLTFFVLLLTMASMDNSVITTISLATGELGALQSRGSGRVTTKAELISELLENPWALLDKKDRIKDLLFPDDVLPPDLSKQDLKENLEILAKREGVALVFTDGLLFRPDSTELSETGKALLAQLVPVLTINPAPVTIGGHAGADETDPYVLSGDRAISVLAFFVDQGLENKKFSLAAVGPDQPVLNDAGEPVESAKNRRVEIYLKTTRTIGGYP